MSHDLILSLIALIVILQFNGTKSLRRCNTCGKISFFYACHESTFKCHFESIQTGVQRLTAEADFRAVKLSWGYLYAQEPPAFRVKYCEVSER